MDKNYTYDIVFCSLPPLGMDRIYSAPAILKGVVESAGYQSRCFDLSSDFFHQFCDSNFDVFARLSNYFVVPNAKFDPEELARIDHFYDCVVDTLINANAKYIGFSVFSMNTHQVTIDLCKRLQEAGLSDRIVLGGRGISCRPSAAAIKLLDITKSEMKIDLVHILKSRGLVKHCIVGDGEDAILEFLKTGVSHTEQNKRDQLDVTWPDYSDYDFNNYYWQHGERSLDVIGSTGCVRDCDFCDVKKQFGRYRFKDGVAFAEELIALQEKFNINKFILADSLSNGGLKIFRQFLNRLVEHNKTAAVPITWSGQYICRDMRNTPNIDQYYEAIAKSGGQGLTIGAESGSDYVLLNMEKKTTVEALFFELENFKRHGITCQILTFIGHWSERHEDFIAHCNMMVRLIPYIRSGTVSCMGRINIYALVPGTPVDYNINIHQDSGIGVFAWIARNNRGNTLKVRLQRRLIISKLCKALDMRVELDEPSVLQELCETVSASLDKFNNFFTEHANNDTSQFDAIANADAVVNSILNNKQELTVQLEVEANSCNGDPSFVIKINNDIVFQKILCNGNHLIEFSVPRNKLKQLNQLSLQMTNKGNNDTEVDSQGSILRDKNIVFKSLQIDNCDLLNDIEFFYKYFYQYKDNKKVQCGTGVWSNQPIHLDFKLPFVQWYSNSTNRNKSNFHAELMQKQVQGLAEREEYWSQLEQIISQIKI